ncbi:MAG: choice-of-anchor D domain-containing protein [Verrucomicrobiales bacterium]
MITSSSRQVRRVFSALLASTILVQPTALRASLAIYDATILADHGDGDGPFPFASTLTEPLEFDTTGGEEFDFGEITEDATFEFIVEGNPDAAQNGYLAVGENAGNSLRYEQWDDTGQLGFTRSGVADYLFIPEGDEDLVLSPMEPTHVTYVWHSGDQRMDLYIDGDLAGVAESATFEMPTGVGFLGANAAGTESMEGTIHRVTTYDTILSPEVIKVHANAWLASDTDPSLQVPAEITLALSGAVQSLELLLINAGANNPLTIEEIAIAGDSADKFTIITELPLTISNASQAALEYTFDPKGEQGTVSASFLIRSNDPQRDEIIVQLSGIVHDPKLDVEAELEFGETEMAVTRPVEVTNMGVSQDLVIESVTFTGDGAGAFSATNPGTIAAGATAQIGVTFTPDGPGSYEATVIIKSNDPLSPETEVAVSGSAPFDLATLSSYDAIIAADHGGGDGAHPYEAVLLAAETFDGAQAAEFDFGEIEGSATFEFILEGDPVEGGQDGFLAVGEDPIDNLRYEQWNDTGQLGFTRLGVADNLFVEQGDPDLLLSPEVPTHISYVWNEDDLTMELYVNGVLAGTAEGVDFAMPTGLGWLGGKNADGAEGMLGVIHRVVTYNEILPVEVILRHATAFLEGGSFAPFSITAIVPDLAAKSVTITWTSLEGVSYRIEKTPVLEDGVEWQELEDGYESAGDETSYTDSSLDGSETSLYYRVVQE